jgi:hypothetical protein
VITTEQVGEVDVTAIARRNRELRKQGYHVPELKSCNGNQISGSGSDYAFGGMGEEGAGGSATAESVAMEKEKQRERQGAERRAAAQLPARVLRLLERTRQRLAADPFEGSRVGKVPIKAIEKAIAASHISSQAAPPLPRRTPHKRPPSNTSSRISGSGGRGSVVSAIIGQMHAQQRQQQWEDRPAPSAPTPDPVPATRAARGGAKDRAASAARQIPAPAPSPAPSSAGNGRATSARRAPRGEGGPSSHPSRADASGAGAVRGRAAHLPPAAGARREHSPIRRPMSQESAMGSSTSLARLILGSGGEARGGEYAAMPHSARETGEGGGRRQIHPEEAHRSKHRSPLQSRHVHRRESHDPESFPLRTPPPRQSAHHYTNDVDDDADTVGEAETVGSSPPAKQKPQRVRLTRAASMRQEHSKHRLSELEESAAGGKGGERVSRVSSWSNEQPAPWVSPVAMEEEGALLPDSQRGQRGSRGRGRGRGNQSRGEWDSTPPVQHVEEPRHGSRSSHSQQSVHQGRPFDHGGGGGGGGLMWVGLDASDDRPIRPKRQQQQQQPYYAPYSGSPPYAPPPSYTPMGNEIRATPPNARNNWSVEMAQQRYGNSPMWS